MEMNFLGYGAADFLCFEAPNGVNGPLLVWAVLVVVIACKDFESDFRCFLSTSSEAANFLKKKISSHMGPQ
jgi:hypothetical protein